MSFTVYAHSNYNGTLAQIASETREELKKEMSKSFGDTITDMKPLKIGGQPALMFDVISIANGIKGSYIDMIANSLLYFFYIGSRYRQI